MYFAYRYELDPTDSQRKKLNELFAAEHQVYIWFYAEKKRQFVQNKQTLYASKADEQLSELIKTDQSFAKLNCLPSQTRFYALFNLDNAFKRNITEHQKMPTLKPHRVKRFLVGQKDFILNEDAETIKLPFICETIKINYSRKLPSKTFKYCTFWRTKNGKYYVSFLCNNAGVKKELRTITNKKNVVGINIQPNDTFLEATNNQSIQWPPVLQKKYDRWQSAINHLQKKKKYSKNYFKQLAKTKFLEQRFIDARKGYYHRLSSKIVQSKQADAFCIGTTDFFGDIRKNEDPDLVASIKRIEPDLLARMIVYKSFIAGKKICVVQEQNLTKIKKAGLKKLGI